MMANGCLLHLHRILVFYKDRVRLHNRIPVLIPDMVAVSVSFPFSNLNQPEGVALVVAVNSYRDYLA